MHLRINSNTNTALNGRADQQCEVHIADLGTSAPISNKTLKHEWIPSLHNFQGSRASECQLALVPRVPLSFFQILFELPQLPLNRCKEGLHVLANLRFVIWGEILLIVEPYVYLTRNIRKDISWATTRGSQSSPNRKKTLCIPMMPFPDPAYENGFFLLLLKLLFQRDGSNYP